MSLLDAFLLDPCRINVWIAYRTDGVKGTGTPKSVSTGLPFSCAEAFDAMVLEFARGGSMLAA